MVMNHFNSNIRIFQSDGGGEFVNDNLSNYLAENGNVQNISCPHTPAENDLVERRHKHLVELGLAMMFEASVPKKFWVEAFSTAVHLINRLPFKSLNLQSSFELL